LATVFFPKSLQVHTGGIERVEIEARDVRQLFRALETRFPALGDRLQSGLAIAIDGEIVNEPLLERVGPDSEIHFLHPVSGG
jgi:molybdopterin converting factor small subunit